jgi:hypothetical protein
VRDRKKSEIANLKIEIANFKFQISNANGNSGRPQFLQDSFFRGVVQTFSINRRRILAGGSHQ